jgi:hypothetical protein
VTPIGHKVSSRNKPISGSAYVHQHHQTSAWTPLARLFGPERTWSKAKEYMRIRGVTAGGVELTGLGGSIGTPALWLKVSVTDTES